MIDTQIRNRSIEACKTILITALMFLSSCQVPHITRDIFARLYEDMNIQQSPFSPPARTFGHTYPNFKSHIRHIKAKKNSHK